MIRCAFPVLASLLALSVPAYAAPRCAADAADLDGSFLTIAEDGRFCEGNAQEQARFEAELNADQQAAEIRQREEARQAQIAQRNHYMMAMRQGGLSARDAARAADAAGLQVEQAAQAASVAADEARQAAEEAARDARADRPASASAPTLASCADGKSCTFKMGNPAKAFRPSLIRF